MHDDNRDERPDDGDGQTRGTRDREFSVNSARGRRLLADLVQREAEREDRARDRRKAWSTVSQGTTVGVLVGAAVNIPWPRLWSWLTGWLHLHTGP